LTYYTIIFLEGRRNTASELPARVSVSRQRLETKIPEQVTEDNIKYFDMYMSYGWGSPCESFHRQ